MLFDDPKICALYLNDALDKSEAGAVAEALRNIRRANQIKARSLNAGCHMHLAELFDILESTGVRLVAVPARAPEAGATPPREPETAPRRTGT